MVDHALIPLPRLSRELVAGGFGATPVDYTRLYRGLLNNLFPAEQVTSNRWSVRRVDLPKAAAALGLTAPAGPKPARAKCVPSNVAAAA